MKKLLNKAIKIIINKKDMLIFTFLKLIGGFIGFFINIFIARKITVVNFGIYSIIMTLLGFVTTFGFSWSSSAIMYIGAKEKSYNGNLNKTFWSRNIILFFSLLTVIIIYTLFYTKIALYIGIDLNILLIIWLFIKVILDYLNVYFLAVKKQIEAASILTSSKILFLIITYFFEYTLKELIIISILCDSLGLLYLTKVDKKDIGKPTFDKENFKNIFNFGIWQLFGFSGLYILRFGDNVVIKYYLQNESVGIYNAAYNLYISLATLPAIFSAYYVGIIIPLFEKKEKRKLKEILYKERIGILLLFLIPHIIIILFSNSLIKLIYGTNYLGSAKSLSILMIGSFFNFANIFSSIIFNLQKKYKELQLLNIVQSILNVIFNILLVPYFGIEGAALGTTGAIIITNLIKIYLGEHYLKIYFGEIENVKDFIPG